MSEAMEVTEALVYLQQHGYDLAIEGEWVTWTDGNLEFMGHVTEAVQYVRRLRRGQRVGGYAPEA